MTNLDSVLKSRDITLLTKVCTVQDMVFDLFIAQLTQAYWFQFFKKI